MTAKALRSRDLAQIHIAKQQLGLDDDTYREMLFTVTRKRSASELDAHERNQVLQHLMSRGWKPKLGGFKSEVQHVGYWTVVRASASAASANAKT